MSLVALQCQSCGGSIAFPEGKPTPYCPFCGSEKQVEKPLNQQILPPELMLDFGISDEEADQSFREFAQSSFWHPKKIRQAKLELQMILLPAWIWSGKSEMHYNGLISAATQSGKRPVSGISEQYFDQILVPSSKAVSLVELNSIAPFEISTHQPFDPEKIEFPYEPGELTKHIAINLAKDMMRHVHSSKVKSQEGLSDLHSSAIFHNLDGLPALLPVYIGVYRQKDKFYRVVINGLSGKLIGEAPFDWVKLMWIGLGCLFLLGIFSLIINF
jgi:hypothetical protein